jgi:two-component system sensor histidine kinase UhpB
MIKRRAIRKRRALLLFCKSYISTLILPDFKMKGYISCLLCLSLLIASSRSIASDIDSLQKILALPIADSLRLEKVDRFAYNIQKTQPAKAFEFSKLAYDYVQRNTFPDNLKKNLIAFFTEYEGSVAGDDNARKIELWARAEKLYKDAGNIFCYANLHRLIGRIYYLQGNHAKGYQYLVETKAIADSSGNKKILNKYLWQMEDFASLEDSTAKALAIQQQILQLSTEQHDTVSIYKSYINIADMSSMLHDFKAAEKYFNLALQWGAMVNDSVTIALNYHDMGENQSRQHYSKEAILYYNKSLDIFRGFKSDWGIEINYKGMSAEYDSLKDYKKGLEYSKLAFAIHDSASQNFYSAKSAEMEARYELGKKEDEIKIANASADRQKLMRNIIIVFIILAAMFAFLLFNRFKLRKRLEAKQALLTERNRIARDLHDDVGATLSSISIFSAAAKQKLKNKNEAEAGTLLERISTDSQDMVSVLSDFVWTLSPVNNSIEKMTDRMQSFASPVLSAKSIRMNFEIDDTLKKASLQPDARKNLFLIFKEAVNNAAKYSDASEVKINMEIIAGKLAMTVSDNGKGFELNGPSAGNGLRNMRERAAEIQAELKISSDEKGTSIQVIV